MSLHPVYRYRLTIADGEHASSPRLYFPDIDPLRISIGRLTTANRSLFEPGIGRGRLIVDEVGR